MTAASDLIRAAATQPCLPWPRRLLVPGEWTRMAAALADEPSLALLALWGEAGHVHALLLDEAVGEPLPVSVAVEAGRYPALSPSRPLAAWFERAAQDLWGLTAAAGTDLRGWLDHGHWPQGCPMAVRRDDPRGRSEAPEFLPVAGDGLDQSPLGPVHGRIEPAAHLHITARGERIARLEVRLGYTHKGTLALMVGKSPRAAARFAARLSGEAAVAHAIAFAQATEAALRAEPPPRSVMLRAVMAELERIAGHLGALGAVGEAAGFSPLPARCGRLREMIHRAANAAFGHRLMMDCVIPGGVAADIAPGGVDAVLGTLADVARALLELDRLCAAGPLGPRLAGIGVVGFAAANRLAAGGVIGRAAGRACDARRSPGYGAYPSLAMSMPVLEAGDAAARTRLRLAEIAESVRLLGALLATLSTDPEPGPVSIPLPPDSGEGIGVAEGARGDIWHWLRLDHGQIAGVFMRDPGWAHWPLFEAIAPQAGLDDLPLIQASFDLASSGTDL
jgi:Ni,Fe-hydrogenase III large subunit